MAGSGATAVITGEELKQAWRLPEQWPGKRIEALVVCAAVGFSIVTRGIIDAIAPGVVPFVFCYPAVIVAALFAGSRAGVISSLLCLLLSWYYVLPPARSFALAFSDGVSLAVSACSLFLTVWIVAGYRTAAQELRKQRDERVELMSLALREADHRTRNNFQIAAALLQSQAAGHGDASVREALKRAAGRLNAIAGIYTNLAVSSADLSTVRLDEQLRQITDAARHGLLPDGVSLHYSAVPIAVTAETAIKLGLIVNECLTNAAKYAFPDGIGEILVSVALRDDRIAIVIADNGIGRPLDKPHGSGTRIMTMLARSLDGRLEVNAIDGTRCVLNVPIGRRCRPAQTHLPALSPDRSRLSTPAKTVAPSPGRPAGR